MFKDRIRDIRKRHDMTQSTLASVAKITDRQFRNLEAGTSDPSLTTLIALADYFDVSLDYLCGRTEDVEKRGEVVYPQFAIRLKELRLKQGVDIWQFAELFDISARNYAGYELGETMPDLPVVAAFADHFDVSIDYLVGRSDDPARR
ncbi:hypothetical protein AGMMS49957_01870 [Synergistales bacterium]|nr:hypothetical protein AGMMS49957_01870 [Synergistales bacterium]